MGGPNNSCNGLAMPRESYAWEDNANLVSEVIALGLLNVPTTNPKSQSTHKMAITIEWAGHRD